jgi:hypothetical protein
MPRYTLTVEQGASLGAHFELDAGASAVVGRERYAAMAVPVRDVGGLLWVFTPPPGEERSVANDGPTLYFRGYYYRELRGSSVKLLPLGRLVARAAAEAKAPDAAAPNGAEVLPLPAKADAV